MKLENLRSLIRESVQEYIKEIDQAANEAAMDARITKCEEAINMRESKLEKLRTLEEVSDVLDEAKVKNIEKEINELKKAKAKFEKQKEKMLNKGKKKEVVADTENDAPLDEADVTAEMDMSEETTEEALNESFLKMQKLAGVITESEYNKKKSLVENQLNEAVFFLTDEGTNLLMDKSKYMTKPGSDSGAYVVYDLSKPKGKSSFGDDDSTQKVGVWYSKESKRPNQLETDDENMIKIFKDIKYSKS
jgi:hypothetical protein